MLGKHSTLNLLALLLLFIPIAAQVDKCQRGSCAACDSELGCLLCIGKKRTMDYTCNGVIPVPNCHIWSDHDGYCKECEKGYAMTERNECVDSEIWDCVKGTRIGNKEICLVCEDDFMPTYNRTFCLDKHEIPECEWGMREGQLEGCALCDKGYSLYGYGCVKNCVDGCKICERRLSGPKQWIQVCTQCDYHRGYWMVEENKCEFGSWLVKLGFGIFVLGGLFLAL